jgi:hypothetical protein
VKEYLGIITKAIFDKANYVFDMGYNTREWILYLSREAYIP